MKDQNMPTMEGNIIEEEDLKTASQIPSRFKKVKVKIPFEILPRVLNYFKNPSQLFTKTKLLILLVLLISLVLIYVSLVFIASRRIDEPSLKTSIITNSPSPSSQVDTKLSEIDRQIQKFNQNVQDLGTYSKNLSMPQIDLEISF